MGLVRLAFRRSFEQVSAYRDAWTAHNAAALAGDGPLWLVLGDSAAQGVGASSHLGGYVGAVLRLGPQWRVVNLSDRGYAQWVSALEPPLRHAGHLPPPGDPRAT